MQLSGRGVLGPGEAWAPLLPLLRSPVLGCGAQACLLTGMIVIPQQPSGLQRTVEEPHCSGTWVGFMGMRCLAEMLSKKLGS